MSYDNEKSKNTYHKDIATHKKSLVDFLTGAEQLRTNDLIKELIDDVILRSENEKS
jgi:hypothetical protein